MNHQNQTDTNIYFNQIIDKIVTIDDPNVEWIINNCFVNNDKKIVALAGEASSRVIWTAFQKKENNEII